VTDDLKRLFDEHLQRGEILVIDGDLTIKDEDIAVIPFLRVRGNLVLQNLFHLRRIWGLEVAGDVVLERCDLLEKLPSKTVVGKTLTLSDNTLLADLGADLHCQHLHIKSCASFTVLDIGINNIHSIHVEHCRNLDALSQSPTGWAPQDLTVAYCGLRVLPPETSVGKNLTVKQCDAFESVGTNVVVGSNLDLSGCKGLRSIGKGLIVGGNLILRDTGLKQMLESEDMDVEGFIDARGTFLKSFPKGVTVMR